MAEIIWELRNRKRVLAASGLILPAIVIVERLTKIPLPVGLLYALPISLAAGFVPRWAVVGIGLVGACLNALFGSLELSCSGFALEFVALAGCGLFAGEWIRNRRFGKEARENLRVFGETIPGAIFTIDEHGLIELANRAATDLVLAPDGCLVGNQIAAFFPELHYALRPGGAPRTASRCRGYRGNGKPFIAHAYYSSYKEGPSAKLALIIAEAKEEMAPAASSPSSCRPTRRAALSTRETAVLRLLVQGLANKEIASRIDIPESSVKQAIQQLFAKTGVRTRAQIVKVALENYRDVFSGVAAETFGVPRLPRKDRSNGRSVPCRRGPERFNVPARRAAV